MVTYTVTKENKWCVNNGHYTSFGINAYDFDKAQNPIQSISDIFLDCKSADRFVSTCNELELDIIHLNDVVEDFLSF